LEVSKCFDNMEMAEQTKAKRSCHSKDERSKMAYPDHQSKTSMVHSVCECGNHQSVQTDFFTLPTLLEISVSAPLILLYQWVEPLDVQVELPCQGAFTASLVSDRLAPRLSVLARFLI
jgi:hypothetical protein